MHEEQNIINYDDFVVCIKCNKVLLKGNQKKHCLCGVNGNYVDFNTYAKVKRNQVGLLQQLYWDYVLEPDSSYLVRCLDI